MWGKRTPLWALLRLEANPQVQFRTKQLWQKPRRYKTIHCASRDVSTSFISDLAWGKRKQYALAPLIQMAAHLNRCFAI